MNINLCDLTLLTEKLKKSENPIVLYGMGNGADKIIALCERHGIKISGVFASDGFAKRKLFHNMSVTTYSEAKEAFGSDLTVLLSFATSRPEVLENIYRIASENTLLAPDVPAYGDNVFDVDFYTKNISALEQVYSLLSDDRSRELYEDIIKYKLTGEISCLQKADDEADFMQNIICSSKIRTFVDAGAYRGDTARKQMQYSNGLKKIIAIEPDPKTYARLCHEFEGEDAVEFVAHNAGLGSKDEDLPFLGDGGRGGSSAVGHGKRTVHFTALDSIINGEKVDYIKYDVEGFEYEALIGSQNTIASSRPQLLVSLYHRSEDIFRLPLTVKEFYPDCRMYLRRLSGIPAWDINLLVIPNEL